jgi:hypothetical protein
MRLMDDQNRQLLQGTMMRRPRVSTRLEWVDITKTDVMVLAVIIAIGLVLAKGWSKGLSVFGFESPFWDLGLIPILTALVIGVCRFRGCDAYGRRFVLGFVIVGSAAIAAYIVSCLRPARWSLVSALLPFQTGLMLAPDVGKRWTDLPFFGIVVDTAILTSLPLVVAAVGGVMFSVRFTMRRRVVTVAVIAIVFGAFVGFRRRVRRFDDLGDYHWSQIVGQLHGIPGPDGAITTTYVSSLDRNGKPVAPHQQRMDRWHKETAERYWHAALRPWVNVTLDPPPPE